MKHARIKLEPLAGESSVVIVADDGSETDITSVISEVEVARRVDGRCTAMLTLPWASGSFLATSVHVPRDTAAALVALGWTPPEDGVASSGNQ